MLSPQGSEILDRLGKAGAMAFRNRTVTRVGLLLTAVAAITPGALVSHSNAQQPTPPSFEVATVKPSDPQKPLPPSLRFSPNRLSVGSMTLQDLISIAYNLTYGADQQISGGPDWIHSEKFDVVAKEDETVAAHLHKLLPEQQGDENRRMLRELLAERFALKVHHETRDLSTYVLSIAKGGPRLKPVVLDPHLPANIPPNRINVMGRGFLVGHDADTALLVKVLSGQPEMDGHIVIDKTGLTRRYDFTLKWEPDSMADGSSSKAETNGQSESLPSFFTALQEQLGLKLASSKEPVDVVVVDSADRPSEN
jgi:uncharacterized protein (TIGR03435 family)